MKLVKRLLMVSTISITLAISSQAGDLVKEGEKIFNTKKLGNCLACHDINGKKINNPGSFGPKLTGLKYWDDKTLYDTIYDIYGARDVKVSAMPPFGKNGWLSDHEIKAVVAYLKTIN